MGVRGMEDGCGRHGGRVSEAWMAGVRGMEGGSERHGGRCGRHGGRV